MPNNPHGRLEVERLLWREVVEEDLLYRCFSRAARRQALGLGALRHDSPPQPKEKNLAPVYGVGGPSAYSGGRTVSKGGIRRDGGIGRV